MLVANRDWLETTTFARAVDTIAPAGQGLPAGRLVPRDDRVGAAARVAARAFEQAAERLAALPDAGEIKRFFRAGGYWRNFKARYPESDEMYARMLGVSQRLAAAAGNPDADPDYLEVARQELYRGQCNCPYWHGSFGGLYLPHLRNAIYRSLIAAHNALDDAEGRTGPRVAARGRRFQPRCPPGGPPRERPADRLGAAGARAATSTSSTCGTMPPTFWPRSIAAPRPTTRPSSQPRPRTPATTTRGTTAKATRRLSGSPSNNQGLDHRLVYDRHPRKALVDHFYPVDVTLDDLIACRETELGDFALGTYLAKVQREAERVALVMERPGRVSTGIRSGSRRPSSLPPASPGLSVHYELDDLPAGVCLHFAVEINLAAMAGHAPDRYYSDPAGDQARAARRPARPAPYPRPHRDRRMARSAPSSSPGRNRPASGASRSRRSARARGDSKGSINRRPSFPTGT